MKKIKHLILHIGLIKAGSSSIQESLGSARDALLEHNIYYPDIKPNNHIFSFVPIFMEDPEESFVFKRELLKSENTSAKIQNYRDVWVNEIEACEKEHFIISAEDFSLPFFTEDAVNRLKTFVEQYFEQVTVIAYARHYDAWIASETQQIIKNYENREIKDIVEDYLTCPPKFSYRNSLSKWVKIFGRENIVVRPFDPQVFYNDSLLADFFHACNLPADEISIPEIRFNVAIGKNAVAFLQKYNQIYPVFIDNSINSDRGLAQEHFPVYLFNNITDEKFKLDIIYSLEQAQKLNEEIDYINQFFTAGYHFQRVSPGSGKTKVPTTDDIPVEFFVHLMNNVNKHIETLQKHIENVREQNKNLHEQNEIVREQNKKLQEQNKKLQEQNRKLQEQNRKLQEQNRKLQEQNAYLQRLIDLFRIPHLLRMLNKLPFLKAILQKATKW